MVAKFFRLSAISSGLLLIAALAGGAFADPIVQKISQFSGKPVPRFESLRYSAVHGRQGPSLDHPILWRYEKEGLPMLIVRETHGWRRVRDKDGDEVWMQARMLSADPTILVTQELTLYKQADTASRALAKLKPGLVAELQSCRAGWCDVSIGRTSGWVEKRGLWGVETETGGL